MMPKDWNQFLPTNLTSRGRQLFSNAQEVKQPPLSTQEVQTDVSDAQGPVDDNSDSHDTMFDQETVSRRLMEDPSSGFTAAPAAAEASNAVATNTCPRYRIIMNEHIKLVHNPLCRGPWLKSLQQRKQKVRQAMQRMSKECAIAAVLPGDPRHNDTSLKRVSLTRFDMLASEYSWHCHVSNKECDIRTHHAHNMLISIYSPAAFDVCAG